jgi:hypothetical protein
MILNADDIVLSVTWRSCVLEILSKVAAPVLAAKDQSHVCLESLSKKFEKDITDERGYRGNFKIGSSKNIFDCPHYAPLHSHTGTLKFSHQQIGIEEEDDKARPRLLLSGYFSSWQYRLLGRFD